MKLYLYSNGEVNVATADSELLDEYLYENGFPRSESVENEWSQRVEVLENNWYSVLPNEYIILEVERNKEYITKRGFELESKLKCREIYVKDDTTLILDWETYMYINVEIEFKPLHDISYSAHRITRINCKELDYFLKFAKEMK